MSLALRAGTCRRNVDGVRLLACGIDGVSVTGVILAFELSLLTIAALLLDVVVVARRNLSSYPFIVALSRSRFAIEPLVRF